MNTELVFITNVLFIMTMLAEIGKITNKVNVYNSPLVI